MHAAASKPMTLSDVKADSFYSLSDFARIRNVHVSTVFRWCAKYKLARTVDGRLLGSTIIRFCGRDARKLAATTISDKEFQKRSDAAGNRVRQMA